MAYFLEKEDYDISLSGQESCEDPGTQPMGHIDFIIKISAQLLFAVKNYSWLNDPTGSHK